MSQEFEAVSKFAHCSILLCKRAATTKKSALQKADFCSYFLWEKTKIGNIPAQNFMVGICLGYAKKLKNGTDLLRRVYMIFVSSHFN